MLLLRVVVLLCVLTEPAFRLLMVLMMLQFPLLLRGFSLLLSSVKVRNNIGPLFLTSQIYVTYLTVRFRVQGGDFQVEIKHKVSQFDTVYLSLKQCILSGLVLL